MEKTSRTEEIIERLRLEGKVREIPFEAFEKWNEGMEKVRKDFLYKQAMSEIHASECYFPGSAWYNNS